MTAGTIGFIGLGRQGGPIAHRILDAGYSVLVWARRDGVAEPFAAKGAGIADGIADLGRRSDQIGLCVFDDDDVRDVCEPLIPAMRAGSRLVIHSTISPQTCRAVADRCADRGIAVVDAAVSGGAAGAEAGTLTVMCGGTEAAFAACLPVFETFGRLILRLGPVGAGLHAKIVNNTLLAANTGAGYAALAAGAALGLDEAALLAVLKASSGCSFGVELCARFPDPATNTTTGKLLGKDAGLLGAILPDDAAARLLIDAATPFLRIANAGPRDD